MVEVEGQGLTVQQSERSRDSADRELVARVTLFKQVMAMLSLGGRTGEEDMALEGYVRATADIPYTWLRHTLAKLVKEQREPFMWPVGEIRFQVTREIIRAKRVAEGKDPDRSDTGLMVAPKIRDQEHWLDHARSKPELAPLGQPGVALLGGGDET